MAVKSAGTNRSPMSRAAAKGSRRKASKGRGSSSSSAFLDDATAVFEHLISERGEQAFLERDSLGEAFGLLELQHMPELAEEPAYDRDSFLELALKVQKGNQIEQQVKQAFKLLCGQNPAGITRTRLQQAAHEVNERIDEEMIEDMFKYADTSEDGIVDYEEFKRLLGKTCFYK